MNTQHTPGPWTVSAKYQIRKAEGVPMLLAEVNNSENAKINGYNAEANARLIAAAPELLKALQELLSDIEYSQNEIPAGAIGQRNIRNAKAAILSATLNP